MNTKLKHDPCGALIAVCALGLLAASSARASAQSSTFDASNEGWLVVNIIDAPGAGTAANWDSVNQRISTRDLAPWTTFSAPAALLGNQMAYYGGSLGFDLTDDQKDANADTVATFGIASGPTSMFWFGGSPSTTAMTTFNAGLSEADARWRIGGSPLDFTSGTAPTQTEFRAVLSALTMLRINADWRTAYNDTAVLDNVVMLSPVPEPTPAVLLAAGLAAVAWRRRWPRSSRHADR